MHAYLHRVFVMVIHRANRPAVLFDAIDRHPRIAASPTLAGVGLRDPKTGG